MQELSVQLFAQLENDTKGSEEEAFGKGGYRFACLHKVCLRHLSKERGGRENERRLGKERLELFHPSPTFKFAVTPEVIRVQSGGLEHSVQEHLECWTNGDESNDKLIIEYFLYCIFRKSWTDLVAFHSGTKFWAEKTHQKKKNG